MANFEIIHQYMVEKFNDKYAKKTHFRKQMEFQKKSKYPPIHLQKFEPRSWKAFPIVCKKCRLAEIMKKIVFFKLKLMGGLYGRSHDY